MSETNYFLLSSFTKMFFPLAFSSCIFNLSVKGSLTWTVNVRRSYSEMGFCKIELNEL
jgi:hypothetical protein